MRRFVAVLLAAAVFAGLLAGCGSDAASGEATAAPSASEATAASTEAAAIAPDADYSAWRVALLTEEASIADHSGNQAVYDAVRSWCEGRGVDFRTSGASESSSAALVSLIDQTVADGYHTLIMVGWKHVDAIKDTVGQYPNVNFILMDIPAADFGRDYVLPANVCTIVFQEQVLGFMAGYAAVKLGYRHLCFLGAAATAPTTRYGYGFVQGANSAAVELDVAREVAVEFAYADTPTADPLVTAYMDDMYRNRGVQLCFVCGGVEASVSEAAQKVTGAKVIGADTDRASVLDPENGESITVTSAEKNYEVAVQTVLSDLIERGLWRGYGGKTVSVGIVSGENLSANSVGLAASTQFADGKFSDADYAALVAALYAGEYTVSDDVKNPPKVEIAVNYLGSVK